MTASAKEADPTKASCDTLLAAPRRPVTRYRPLLIAAAGVLAGAVSVTALVIGLSPPKRTAAAQAETRAEGASAPMDATVAGNLPDYGDPEGPLGAAAAAVRQTGQDQGAPATLTPASSPQSAQAGATQTEADAAARSGPFFSGASLRAPSRELDQPDLDASEPAKIDQMRPGPATAPDAENAPPSPSSQTLSDHKSAFIAAARSTAAVSTLSRPPSSYEVAAGAVIPAALITALNSDLPGEAIAQVTQNVYDSATGRYVLIPKGARLIGRYDSQLSYGQGRALMVWTRIVMPDGRSVDLGGMTGADLSGASGLADHVNTHIGPLTRAIALSTAITVGGAVAQNAATRSSNGLVLNDAAGGLSAQASQVGARFVDRDLNRQPTVQVRPGWPLTVLVSKDLILEPY